MPFDKPLTMQRRSLPVTQVAPPGDAVTAYDVMGDPPSAGATHVTTAASSPAEAVTDVGAAGAVGSGRGLLASDGGDGVDVPAAFVAVTVTV